MSASTIDSLRRNVEGLLPLIEDQTLILSPGSPSKPKWRLLVSDGESIRSAAKASGHEKLAVIHLLRNIAADAAEIEKIVPAKIAAAIRLNFLFLRKCDGQVVSLARLGNLELAGKPKELALLHASGYLHDEDDRDISAILETVSSVIPALRLDALAEKRNRRQYAVSAQIRIGKNGKSFSMECDSAISLPDMEAHVIERIALALRIAGVKPRETFIEKAFHEGKSLDAIHCEWPTIEDAESKIRDRLDALSAKTRRNRSPTE